MQVNYLIAAGALAILSTAAIAQEQTSPAPMMIGVHQGPVLRSGTPVALRTTTNLTTRGRHLKVGDRFSLEVAEAVTVSGYMVIPVGSPAVGEVTSIRNKGMWGKSGNIETRLLYISTQDRKIRISGSIGDKGVKAGGGAIATSALVFLPAGFFMTGTSAVIPPGTAVTGILEEDIPLAFATAPQPAPALPMAAPAMKPGLLPVSLPASADDGVTRP